MYFLYDILMIFAAFAVRIAALFSTKMKLFSDGRKQVWKQLSQSISAHDKVIWIHAASLGEYEQGLPVMEKLREKFPAHKLLLTFFSPSGYEVRKNSPAADVVTYLPLDSRANASRFLKLAHPEIAVFIKYEYWPNYLRLLKNANVPTYLVSGIFRPGQVFFKWYGGFYRKALGAFRHFFVQNDASAKLLKSLGKTNVTVSGDTRFDRVAAILERDNTLGFIEAFAGGKPLVVIGSSWPKDEEILIGYINSTKRPVKFVIAPHNIKAEQIAALRRSIQKNTALFSEMDGKDLAGADVFIVDTIGILTKIYSYASIAYVGGGFGNPGVHNILEPATFGVPVICGPNFGHFSEAVALVNLGGCIPVSDGKSLAETLDKLLGDEVIRQEKGHICSTFVSMNKGATEKIMTRMENDAV
jgi:3-deoxy-D-manno-octulosonic-acid transferase